MYVDSRYVDYREDGMAHKAPDEEMAYVRAGIGSDLDTMLVFNLLRTHSYLGGFLDADLRRWDLTAAQLNTLLVMRAAGAGGLRMGEIGRRLVVTRSNVTGLVDRLQRAGLVQRTAQADRRATLVRLTRAGAALLARSGPRHAEAMAELASCLTDREKRSLIRLLTKLRRGLRLRRKGAG